VSNTKTGTKTRWTREFKLQALWRMDAAADVTALAAELGCRRELLYIWRRKVRTGGAEALHAIAVLCSNRHHQYICFESLTIYYSDLGCFRRERPWSNCMS
jgi:hypothetical protein